MKFLSEVQGHSIKFGVLGTTLFLKKKKIKKTRGRRGLWPRKNSLAIMMNLSDVPAFRSAFRPVAASSLSSRLAGRNNNYCWRSRARRRAHLARRARRMREGRSLEMKNWIGTGRVYSSSADSWRSPLEAYECLRANSTAAIKIAGAARSPLREREKKSGDIHPLPLFLISCRFSTDLPCPC